MKLNEIKPLDQINVVVEVIEVEGERFYNLRLSNGAIVKCCKISEEISSFFDELEFPNVPTSRL